MAVKPAGTKNDWEVNLLGAISETDIISIIKKEIEDFDWDDSARETGEVIWVGDGIATIYGIDHAMYGEIVTFENGVKGMVQDIRQNEIGCILFGSDLGIKEGTKVVRTKKKAGIPVGDAFLGRVVNALGEPIDGEGDIKEDDKCKYDRLQSALFCFQYFGKQRLVPAVHPVEFANCHCGRPLQQKICRSGNDLHFFLLFLSQKHFHGL